MFSCHHSCDLGEYNPCITYIQNSKLPTSWGFPYPLLHYNSSKRSVDIAVCFFLGRIQTSSASPFEIIKTAYHTIISVSRDLSGQTPVCAIYSQRISLNSSHNPHVSSVPLAPPPSSNQDPSLSSNSPPNERAHGNSNRPRLPRPIPIQRNWNRAEPRANQRASRSAEDLVQRRGKGQDLEPVPG